MIFVHHMLVEGMKVYHVEYALLAIANAIGHGTVVTAVNLYTNQLMIPSYKKHNHTRQL